MIAFAGNSSSEKRNKMLGGGDAAMILAGEQNIIDEIIDGLSSTVDNITIPSGSYSTPSATTTGTVTSIVSSFLDVDFVFKIKNYKALDDDNLSRKDNIRD